MRFILALLFCGLPLVAYAGDVSLPSLALDPPPLPSTHWNGLSFGGGAYALSSTANGRLAVSAQRPNEKAGAGSAGDNGLHVSLHMFTGAFAGGAIRH